MRPGAVDRVADHQDGFQRRMSAVMSRSHRRRAPHSSPSPRRARAGGRGGRCFHKQMAIFAARRQSGSRKNCRYQASWSETNRFGLRVLRLLKNTALSARRGRPRMEAQVGVQPRRAGALRADDEKIRKAREVDGFVDLHHRSCRCTVSLIIRPAPPDRRCYVSTARRERREPQRDRQLRTTPA